MEETIEGRNPVLEALRAGRPVNKILVAENIERHTTVGQILDLSRSRGVPVEFVPRQVLDRSSVTRAHQGIIACAAAKGYVTLDDVLSISAQRHEEPLCVVLDGVEDPQNLGSILRSADGAGVHGVVVRSRRAVGLTPAVAKASAGAVEYVAVARVVNIAQTIESLKKSGVWAVGIDREGKERYDQVDLTLPTAIVVGGEGSGLSPLVKRKCDVVASIPMRGRITSLNAAVAAAVVMYEAVRQRIIKKAG